MRNDIEQFQQVNFSFIIFDESQQIKNASSKTASAAFMLNGDLKIALTGTPIENHLSDLWSQMQFVNTDLLGSLSDFNKYYGIPIAKNPEAPQHEKLMMLVSPYILRRTKQQVAPELPPLTETVIYCDMAEDQRERYEQEKSRMRNSILEGVDETQMKQESSVYYLTALMKLRQLANHPRLLFPEEKLSSGKFEAVMEWLETILDENHKVLIFSSFVTQLEILEEFLVEREIPFSKLTGVTGKREEVIKTFRNDQTKRVFLISLKAGGVGLNLAEADYVFILDPWWNPAAESQAISRSHRIGQQKSVFVYRFITKESIEEKIMRMQEKKRQLAENTILEESFYSGLSREELLELMQ
jgi:SNF2 family DNA or RNA helicase